MIGNYANVAICVRARETYRIDFDTLRGAPFDEGVNGCEGVLVRLPTG